MQKYGAPLYGADTYGVALTLPAAHEVAVQNLAPSIVSAMSAAGATAELQIEAHAGGVIIGALPVVPGDIFESPIELTGSSGSTTVNLQDSTWQDGEPATSFLTARTVWLHLPQGISGLLTVTSSNTAIPYWIEVFVGTSLGHVIRRAGAKYVPTTAVATGGGLATGPINVSTPISKSDSVYIRVANADGSSAASLPISYSVAAITSSPILQLTTTVLQRSPGMLQIGITNALANETVSLAVQDVSDTTVATDEITVDSMGSAANASVILPALPSGNYTIGVAHSTNLYGGAAYGSSTYGPHIELVSPQAFTIVNEPIPVDDAPPADSTPDTGTQPPDVVRWVFEDPVPSGLGTYTVPINPETMTSPWGERTVTTEHTVAPSGVLMSWEGMPVGQNWSFKGTVLTQEHKDKLTSYAAIARRIYVTDHRSRVWIVGIQSIDWTKVGRQADLYHWQYEVTAMIFGSLTAAPSFTPADPTELIYGFDSNGVKLGTPTATLSGSTVTASVTVNTSRPVDFTLLQVIVEPTGSGTAFSLGANPGSHSGTVTLSGSGQLSAAGVWRVSAAYAVAPSPVDSDLVRGPYVQVGAVVAAPTPPVQPPATPGAGAPPSGSGLPWLGASEKEAANGSLAAWLGSTIDVGGSWADTFGAQTEQWPVQPGAPWGSWNKPFDLAVGAIYKPNGQSWAAAAGGAYVSRWQTALNKINSGWGSRSKSLLYLSFARECNGSFNTLWNVSLSERANYITAFRMFADMVRVTLPGAHIVWSLNDGTSMGFDFRTAYPGSAYVDVLGIDTYNSWPHVKTQAAFNSKIVQVDGYGCPTGIESWRQYAASIGKPMCIPEWSNDGNPSSAGGGGESPLYVQAMHNWLKTNAGTGAGKVLYAVLFNQWTQYQFWPNTIQPATAAAWRQVMRTR